MRREAESGDGSEDPTQCGSDGMGLASVDPVGAGAHESGRWVQKRGGATSRR